MAYLNGFIRIVLISLLSGNSIANDFSAIPIGFNECDQLPVDMERQSFPAFCYGNPSVAFLIEGEGLITLKEGSLIIDQLSLDGIDISKDRIGNPAYKLSTFPGMKTSGNGKYLVFQLEINPIKFGNLQRIKLDARVNVIASNKYSIATEQQIDLSKPFSIDMGPYQVTNMGIVSGVTSDEKVIAKELSELLNGEHPLNYYMLDVSGNLDALIDLSIVVDKYRLKSTSYYSVNSKKNLRFEIPSKHNVGLELKYWEDSKEISVPFEL